MALVVSVLESQFTGDPKNFDQAADHVETRSKQLENAKPKVEVDGDVQDVLAKMGEVDAEGNKLATRDYDPKIDADIAKATGKVGDITRELEVLRRLETSPEVDADIAKAEAKLGTAENRLRALEGLRAEMTVDADAGPAEAALDGVADKAAKAGTEGGGQSGKNLVTGIVAALATIPIAGAIVGIAKAAGDAVVQGFQEGLQVEVRADRLAATTGLDEATVARLGAAAGEAYANNFGVSIEENMETARTAVQSGLLDPEATQRDAQSMIQSLSGVADILGEDIPNVARAAATVLRTGLAKDAQGAFDLIVKGQQAGLNVSEDWLDTLNEYGTQFRKIGLDGPEALGLMSQAVKAGARDTDIAADAIKEFSIRAVDGSTLSAEGFEAVGLNAAKMTAQIAEGGPKAAEGLDAVLDGLRKIEDPAKRDAAAVALFGTQAEDLGKALFAMDLDTAARGFQDLGGAAERALTTLGGNTAGVIASAQRNIEVAGEGIKGALAEAFAPQIEGFATFVSENREAVVTFLFEAANGAIDFGRALAEGAAAGTEGFGDFVGSTGPAVMDLIGAIIEGLDSIPFVDLGDASAEFEKIREDAEKSFAEFDKGSEVAADGIRRNLIENGLDPAQDKLNHLGDGLIENAALSDATNRLAGEIAGVGYAADGSQLQVRLLNGQFDTTTKTGKRLDGQVRAVRDSLYEQVSAAAAAGEGQKSLRGRVESARSAFIDQMEAMGLTSSEAERLADRYGLIPEKVLTKATLDDQASAKAHRIKGEIDAIPSQKTVTITSILQVIGKGPSQYVTQRASGGAVGPEYGDVLVGEEGPELVRFAQAGTVIPAARTASLMSSSDNRAPTAGPTYQNTFNNYGDQVTPHTVFIAQRRAELNRL